MIFENNRLIDLTLSYDDTIAGFSKSVASDYEKDGWNASWLNIHSHVGTHIDAPWHFGINKTIDEFEPKDLMGKAWIADVRKAARPDGFLEIEDLGAAANQVKVGDSLILWTDWSRHLGNRVLYRNQLPRISAGLANWMVERKIKMLGVEAPSIAKIDNLAEVTQIHKTLLNGNVIIIEGLTNIDQIKQPSVFLMAFPLKIKDGDGAPARVVAVEG